MHPASRWATTRRRYRRSGRSRSGHSGADRGARPGSAAAELCPTGGPDHSSRPCSTSASAPTGAGFQAEGLVWLDGVPVQGVHPRRTAVPLPELGPGPFSFLVEAASNPSMPAAFRPTTMGSLHTAGERPLYRLVRADLAVRDDDVYGLLLDVEVLNDVMLALPLDDPRRARLLRALASAFDTIDIDDVPGTAAAARARLAARVGRARPTQLDAGDRRRPRAHRLGVAVAHPRDGAQVRPHVRLGGSADGRPPRLPVRVLAGRPVPVDAAAVPGAVRAHHGEGGRRPVRAGRRHVGGSRHEPAQRREPGAPVGARAAVVRRAVRHPVQRGVDPRRVRLPRHAAADLRRGRLRPVRHPEAQLEQAEPLPAQHVLVGGPRRHARAHPLPAGRHLQRRGRPAARWCSASTTSRTTGGATGRSCRTATATVAAGRPARWSIVPRACATSTVRHDCHSARATSSSTTSRPRRLPARRCPRGAASCTSRCTGARSPARSTPSWATAAASGCCAKPSCGGPPAARCRPTSQPSSISCGRTCCCSSSTTSSPARRSRGCTPTPRPPTPGWPTASSSSSPKHSPGCRSAVLPSPTPPHIRVREVTTIDGGAVERRPDAAARVGPLGVRAGGPRVGPRPAGRPTVRRPDRGHRAHDGERPPVRAMGSRRNDRVDHRRRPRARAAADRPLGHHRARARSSRRVRRMGPRGVDSRVGHAAPRRGTACGHDGRRGSTGRAGEGRASVRPLDDDHHVHDASRQCAARHRLRHRLARGRAAAVADGAARRARIRRVVRHPVRGGPPADACEQPVGRSEVRGVCPSVRRRRRTRLRRGSTERRPLRSLPVRRWRAGVVAARGEVPRSRRRSRSSPSDDLGAAARCWSARGAGRGRGVEHAASIRRTAGATTSSCRHRWCRSITPVCSWPR